MQPTFKTLAFFTALGLFITRPAQCQVKLALETGVTYHSNDAGDSASHLADFFAFTINPRIILNSSGYSALALEIPFSLRAKRNENITNRFGMHLPLLLTYSIGSGSGGPVEYTRHQQVRGNGRIWMGIFL